MKATLDGTEVVVVSDKQYEKLTKYRAHDLIPLRRSPFIQGIRLLSDTQFKKERELSDILKELVKGYSDGRR